MDELQAKRLMHQREEERDNLLRGCVYGVVFSLAMWGVIGLAVYAIRS